MLSAYKITRRVIPASLDRKAALPCYDVGFIGNDTISWINGAGHQDVELDEIADTEVVCQ